MIVSKIDRTVCKNNLGLSIHLRKHGMTIIDYLEKYEGFEKPKCPYCDLEVKTRSKNHNIKFNKTCGSKGCSIEHKKTILTTEETKNKIREKRLNYLSNKDNFSRTSWGKSSQGEMTYGEEWLHRILELEDLYLKYDIVFQYPIFPYSIDFAFVNEKIALEFDGKCHFISGKRIDHDFKRDKYLESKGWRTFRVSYDEMKNFDIKNFLEFIESTNPLDYEKKFEERLIKSKEIKVEKKGNKRELNNIKYDTDQYKIAEIVSSSNIDFKSFGWVKQVSLLTGKRHQKINSWMKKYLPEIYENSYKKRSLKWN
jgi:very-short-patch-repair endonuclease